MRNSWAPQFVPIVESSRYPGTVHALSQYDLEVYLPETLPDAPEAAGNLVGIHSQLCIYGFLYIIHTDCPTYQLFGRTKSEVIPKYICVSGRVTSSSVCIIFYL